MQNTVKLIALRCLALIVITNGAFVNGMNVGRTQELDGIDSTVSSDEITRPVLKHGSFGYTHAHHLNPDYVVNDHDFSNSTDERSGQHNIFFHRPSIRRPRRRRLNANARPQSPEGFDDACEGVNIACDERTKQFRTPDGSCNNLQNPSWGKSETAYRRILQRKHSLASECAKGELGTRQLPNPRLSSRMLAERIVAHDDRDSHKTVSIYAVLWGQVVDHDLVLTPLRQTDKGEFLDCCDPANDDAKECCSIKTPKGDFFYGRNGIPTCIPFLRSKMTDPIPDGCENSRQDGMSGMLRNKQNIRDIENGNTHFLDASHVYGSSAERSTNLRAHRGGKLKTNTDRTGRSWPPLISEDGEVKMEFGDTRGDVHPAFTLIATLGVRFHNKIAEELARLRPDWDDERLFQEAKKLQVAIHQHITYTQWMDALLGTPNDLRTNDNKLHEDFYLPSVDPSISLIFSTAAYRLHTLIPGSFAMRNRNYRASGQLLLRNVFHQPLKLLENGIFDDLIRGMTMQVAWEFNNIYSEDMTEMLFAEENDGKFGMDIVALNVQRGRDHQIHGYAAYREACGLGSINSWNDMSEFIPHNLVHRLMHAYKRPEDADMYIAANMESRLQGSLLGPTTHCLVREQFEKTRDGDRHFYTRPSEFNTAQLASIKRSGSLSHVLCAIADDPSNMWLPRNMFQLANRRRNPLVRCSQLPFIDLRPWANI